MSFLNERSYEEVLKSMLDRVDNQVDKREGSILYDALAPSAYVYTQQLFELRHFLDLVFITSSAGEYLDRAAAAAGITRKQENAAVRKIVTGRPTALGTRWSINDLAYQITKVLSDNEYEAACETAGDVGNQYSGTLQPLSGAADVQAELKDIILAGNDTESDDALRERALRKIRLPSTSGNKYDYYNWAMEYSGVGAAKVFPLADGPGTVKIVIADASMKAAGKTLVEDVFHYIEEKRPVGAAVHVVSASEMAIDISADVKLKNGVSPETVQAEFAGAVNEFFEAQAFNIEYISMARIGNILLNLSDVEDYSNLALNGKESNILLADEEIAVAGTVTLGVL